MMDSILVDGRTVRVQSCLWMSRRRLPALAIVLGALLMAPAPRAVSCVGATTARCCARCPHARAGHGAPGCCLSRLASPGVLSAVAKAPVPRVWGECAVVRLDVPAPAVFDRRVWKPKAHAPPGASLYDQRCLIRI